MDTNSRTRGEVDPDDCIELLATKTIGRLIHTRDALPAVQPVRYLLDDETLIFCTGQASIVRSRDGTVVAFEVDDLDADTGAGWVVTVIGEASTLSKAEATRYCPETLRPLDLDCGERHVVALPHRPASHLLGVIPRGRLLRRFASSAVPRTDGRRP